MNYRLMIERFCLDCKENDLFAISNCDNIECALHEGRPNRSLQGKQENDYDDVSLAEQIEDQLNVNSLQRMLKHANTKR